MDYFVHLFAQPSKYSPKPPPFHFRFNRVNRILTFYISNQFQRKTRVDLTLVVMGGFALNSAVVLRVTAVLASRDPLVTVRKCSSYKYSAY